jgi:subtilisin family serine protease
MLTKEHTLRFISVIIMAIGVATVIIFTSKQIDHYVMPTKRYVIYNTKDFERKPNQKSTMSVSILESLGAKDVKQLELINGMSFEGDIAAANLMEKADADWVIQEEFIHSTFQKRCMKWEPIPCPGNPGPGPGPTPVPEPSPEPSPTPTPGPIEADKSWGRQRVHAKEAMALVDTSAVRICIVDDGIDMNHPGKGNVIGTVSFTGEPVSPGGGHGSHTSGSVGGTGGIGISKSSMLICKGLSNSGSGSSSGLAQCLTWCGQQGAQIVSNSWGSPQQDNMINQAIAGLTAKSIAVVVSNGNDGRGTLNWPAQLSINNPLVFGSAASDQQDQRARFSTYGPGTKFISPGVDIISNKPGGGTVASSGTSMSAPHLSGILAFCVARKRPLTTCVKSSGIVGGYPFADAELTAK